MCDERGGALKKKKKTRACCETGSLVSAASKQKTSFPPSLRPFALADMGGDFRLRRAAHIGGSGRGASGLKLP